MKLPAHFGRWVIGGVLVAAFLGGGAMSMLLLNRPRPAPEPAQVATVRPVPVRPSFLVDVPDATPEMLRAQEEQRRQSEATVAALTVTALAAAKEDEIEGDPWVVTAEAVNIRAGPSSLAEAVGTLLQGAIIHATEEDSGWLKFAGPSGAGWVYSKNLTRQQ